MRRLAYCAITALLTTGVAYPIVVNAKDDDPIPLTEIRDRPGKSLLKAAYGRGGRLGAFYDVDADGHLEFVSLERDGKTLELSVLQVDRDEYSLQLTVGSGVPAGLIAVNLDEDAELEFIVAHGERLEGLKKGLIIFASAVVGAFAAVPVGGSVYLVPVLRPNSATDLYNLDAFDDDGTPLWHRDLKAEAAAGETWDETRFQWVVPYADASGASILISDDGRQELIALSAEDGRTLWSQRLLGDYPASKRNYSYLLDRKRMLPVLFSPGEMLVLDPVTGAAIFDGAIENGVGELPSWQVFRIGDEQGFLVLGEKRTELRMISLNSGRALWSHSSDEVLEILPLAESEQFIAVWEDRIGIFDASGKRLAEHTAPDKIKTKFSPVYRDLNADGNMEFVFVSGKKILCWNLATDQLRWTAGLGGMLGGANPIEIFDAFYDIDGDGWLDVPAKKGSGEGHWLSGNTGEVLISGIAGATTPILGDWDDNGRLEMFWYKTWYEIGAAH